VSVYVDNARIPFGRMLMCHMLADTESELHEMARAIGVARRHYQGDHYDVCLSKQREAIKRGARLVGSREIATVRKRLREGRA